MKVCAIPPVERMPHLIGAIVAVDPEHETRSARRVSFNPCSSFTLPQYCVKEIKWEIIR